MLDNTALHLGCVTLIVAVHPIPDDASNGHWPNACSVAWRYVLTWPQAAEAHIACTQTAIYTDCSTLMSCMKHVAITEQHIELFNSAVPAPRAGSCAFSLTMMTC